MIKRTAISRMKWRGRLSSAQREEQDTLEALEWVRTMIKDFLAQTHGRRAAALKSGRPVPSVITSIDDLTTLLELEMLLREQLPLEKIEEDHLTDEWLKEDEIGRELVAETWRRKMAFVNRKKGIVGSVAEPQGAPKENEVL